MSLIKVSIITGFLGVGKTSLIKKLIQVKPPAESWAVIVNEFGEIGVDALLLADPSIEIKQVPGGCACCAAQLPFQLSLNQLLKSKTLHRIFIEPSGLGHADSLSVILKQSQYERWLTLNSVVTLIDPVQFSNPKYREHEIYQRQMHAANAFLVSKQDLASKIETQAVYDYMAKQNLPCLSLDMDIQDLLSWMDDTGLNPQTVSNQTAPSRLAFAKFKPVSQSGSNTTNDSFYRLSLDFTQDDVFDLTSLRAFIQDQGFSRIKGLIKTAQTTVSVNCSLSQISIEPYDHQAKKYLLEIIHHEPIDQGNIKQKLSWCINRSAEKSDKNAS